MTLPDNAPSWAVLAFFIFAVISAAARSFSESSESVAKVLGPIGRRWRERAAERTARKRNDVASMTRQQVQQMVDDAVEKKTQGLSDELHELSEYHAYDAEWHRDKRVYMAEQGWELPPPAHLTLSEWKTFRTYQSGGSV